MKTFDIVNIRPNKKISVFRITVLEILGRVGTHILKNTILCIFKRIKPFKIDKIIFFQKTGKKFLVSPVNLGRVGLP